MHVVVAGETVLPVGGAARRAADLAGAVREIEAAERPRWVWADTRETYPPLLRAGVRVARCHDIALTEALLLAYEGRYGESRTARAVHARLHGLPEPDDQPDVPGTLFAPEPLGAEAVAEVLADQLRRIEALPAPGRFRLLVAAESAGALVAAEISHDGMPWRRDVHDALLTELLGPRPVHGMRPAKLQALAGEVAAAFGHPVNPDSVQQLVKAFKGAGVALKTTRSGELKQIDHPAVAPLLAYKELARLFSFHGWVWADQWVRDGRFRAEYVVGGVVSGRWATSGGGG
ncbi:bifunctional 3'-5' exonuclease/DNA polymerase, partial [Nonomuraea basaltis]